MKIEVMFYVYYSAYVWVSFRRNILTKPVLPKGLCLDSHISFWPFDWYILNDWLAVWMSDWLTDRDWLIDRSMELFIDWFLCLLIDEQFVISSNRLETWILLYALRILRTNLTVALPAPTAREILYDIFKHIQGASVKFFRPTLLFRYYLPLHKHSCLAIRITNSEAIRPRSWFNQRWPKHSGKKNFNSSEKPPHKPDLATALLVLTDPLVSIFGCQLSK